MCGFTGYWGSQFSSDEAQSVLQAMGEAIEHRGPDDSGQWFDLTHRLGLSHRRLSIVDLSPAGHQPMHSVSSRFVIAFNGEVYNHLKLRTLLEVERPLNWRGHSDTETLLACFEQWGIQHTLKQAIGMFALAVWDSVGQSLTLTRDRLGEKPLYFGWQQGVLLFGSELKALRKHPAFCAPIQRNALALYLRHNYIPAPYTIYHDIEKLQPGTLITFDKQYPKGRVETYWSATDVATAGRQQPFTGTAEQAVAELDDLLSDAIGQQMVADVSLGAFLSGGVDSSAVVALMQSQSKRPVKTFSIGFNEAQFNEAEHAKAVAKHLGTDHIELYVTPEDCLGVIPKLGAMYDEPFADSSQIPTYLVSQLAKTQVTVSLSGDAGDELFAGYNRYNIANKVWSKVEKLPTVIRRAVAAGLTSVSPSTWNSLYSPVTRFAPEKAIRNIGDKLHKGAGVLHCQSIEDVYLNLVSHWHEPEKMVLNSVEPLTRLTDPAMRHLLKNPIEQMMLLDQTSYLPDDILVKVDRAGMAVSLEGRVPFLDHRVVEFAWQLPLEYKLRDGQTKWCLRQVLYKHVPKALIERPKMGFGVPIDSWLRGPLRDWASDLLDPATLRQQGFFDEIAVQQMWAEHLSERLNWQYHLWDILMFQAWLAEQQ
jgi:asparagine synthase (glutamine-hydrolysing)